MKNRYHIGSVLFLVWVAIHIIALVSFIGIGVMSSFNDKKLETEIAILRNDLKKCQGQ